MRRDGKRLSESRWKKAAFWDRNAPAAGSTPNAKHQSTQRKTRQTLRAAQEAI
jgi:hypothetical protein